MASLAARITGAPAARFAAGNYVAVLLNLIQGILFARILGPERYGVWISLLLLFQYGQHTHLGAINSVLRQIPLRRGSGDEGGARALAGAARGLLLLSNIGWLSVGAVLAATLYREVWAGAVVIVAVTAVEIWSQLAQAEMKTAHRFGAVAALIAGRATLNLALLPLVIVAGLGGAYLRWALVALAVLFMAWRLDPVHAAWRFSRSTMAFLVRDGGPILLVGVLFALQTSLDRTLIFLLLDDAAMARYGVAAILMTVMLVIPGAVGQTSYPRMLESFGRDGDARILWPSVRRRVVLVAVVTAGIAALGGWLLPPLVAWILPAYTPGIGAAQRLLVGSVFLAASVPSSYLLQTIRRQGVHALVSAGAVVLQILLGILAIRTGRGVEGVAAATSTSFGVYALALTTTAWICSRRGPSSGA